MLTVTVEDQTLPEGSKYGHDSASPSHLVKLLSLRSESLDASRPDIVTLRDSKCYEGHGTSANSLNVGFETRHVLCAGK